VKPPYLSTFIDERDNAASFDLALSTGEYYDLTAADMRQIAMETLAAVSGWRQAATKLGLSRSEIDRMSSAFEHKASDDARAFTQRAVASGTHSFDQP
jgi:serine/threonine-protein kinase HipA